MPLIALTAIYLVCELAFNARLLDVVGSGASHSDIATVETYGRALSSIAVALVVLQLMMRRTRQHPQSAAPVAQSPSGRRLAIVVSCGVAAALTYAGLKALVDHLVEQTPPQARRTAMTLVLLQQALLDGRAQLAGLNEDRELLGTPAGKAFLALFPAMAMSVQNVDAKLQAGKLQLLRAKLEAASGGVQHVYNSYRAGAARIAGAYERHYAPASAQILGVDEEIDRAHRKAWADYAAKLAKQRLHPNDVPIYLHHRVRQQVINAGVPVERSWQPHDEPGFRRAVASKVRSRIDAVKKRFSGIPPGLSYPAYFAHPSVQAQIRAAAKLPDGITVKPAYASAEQFMREVYTPMIEREAARELARLDAPVEQFASGGELEQRGLDGARALLVPPLALFFSLVGAIGHTAKLGYLVADLALAIFGRRMRVLWALPLAIIAAAWIAFSHMDNAVTRMPLYQYMSRQIAQGTDAGAGQALQARALANVMHVISIGQGHGYPISEALRQTVLFGFKFGYDPIRPAPLAPSDAAGTPPTSVPVRLPSHQSAKRP